MPPLLSKIFSDDDDGASSNQSEAQADAGLELSPEITIGIEGEYQDASGTTHEYSHELTLGAEVSTEVIVDMVSGSEDSAS